MTRACVAALLLACASPALADDDTGAPRLSGHLGLSLVTGPKVSTNGRYHGNPYGGLAGPGPTLALRCDWPLAEVFLLGLEARLFMWNTDIEQSLGYGMHDTADLGLQPSYRIAGIDDARSELHVSLPIGISVDRFDAGGRAPWNERVENSPGFHVGALVGYQRRWIDSSWGHVFEAGVIYHHLQKRFVYEGGGADEVVYQPFDLFVRAGLVVYFGR